MAGSVHTSRVGTGRTLIAWIVYDMAAHGYTLIVSGVGFPLYFASFVAADRGNADMLWSIAIGLPLLVAGLLGPWIGALADATGRRRALLAAMTIACGAATAMLVMVGAGDVALGIALFAVAHATHLLATSLYNSYLPLIVAPGSVRSRLRAGVGTFLLRQRRVLSAVPAVHARRSRARQRRPISPSRSW